MKESIKTPTGTHEAKIIGLLPASHLVENGNKVKKFFDDKKGEQ